mgnify:CR=1 FL=1
MASGKINVNKADINLAGNGAAPLPLDVMGLFFFAYRDFTRAADEVLDGQAGNDMIQATVAQATTYETRIKDDSGKITAYR